MISRESFIEAKNKLRLKCRKKRGMDKRIKNGKGYIDE